MSISRSSQSLVEDQNFHFDDCYNVSVLETFAFTAVRQLPPPNNCTQAFVF